MTAATDLPDCPSCRSPDLEIARTHTDGSRWLFCTVCAASVLLAVDGTILRVILPRREG